jgi:hypothetical protein
MKQLLDDTPLTFGKHKGMTPNDIAVVDPQYIVWAYDNLRKKPCTRKLRDTCEDMSYDDDSWQDLANFYDETTPW